MQVSSQNDVKQYNLTAGRSLPEWLDERKRRLMVRKDVELRRRVELLQDFSMPTVSDCLEISPDGDYVLATGTYKPRVRCYDVHELGLKFERCLDSEVTKFKILSQDYSKLVLMRCNRYIEFHTQQGRYYELRIPRYGRDFQYQKSTCELLFVGSGPEIIRFNLEQGRFLNPMTSETATGMNACILNPQHDSLLMTGTVEGRVEAWDTRASSKRQVATLDCAAAVMEDQLPQITSLAFRDGLHLGVGTSTGQVVLYDIRSSKQLLVKDHRYGDPIKRILFHHSMDQVVSLDNKVVRIWDRQSGKPYTSIEAPPEVPFNDVAIYPDSGLLFMANEQPKMQVHYIPSMGPAPKWCSFLDNITEEIEESQVTNVYDDYKFVTRQELEDLGLSHLIGTSLLRAYMHGFFVDARLYNKVYSLAKPYSLDRFMKEKISQKLEEKRTKRVQLKSVLPKVNKDLFMKLKDQDVSMKKKKASEDLLKDDRFGALFDDERFAVDTTEEAYRLLNPVLSKLDDSKKKKLVKQFEEVDEEPSDENDAKDGDSDIESSDDEDREWTQKVREQHKKLRVERAIAKRQEKDEKLAAKLSEISRKEKAMQPSFYELKDGETFGKTKTNRSNKVMSLEERLENEDQGGEVLSHNKHGHVMTFKAKKSRHQLKAEAEAKAHREERLSLRRSASHLKKKRLAPKFFAGKRVS